MNRWPAAHFAALAEAVAAGAGVTSPALVLTGGPGERSVADEVTARTARVQLDLVGRTDLLTLAAVLERARLVVTGDTGALHLAVAVGARVLALFGPADPSRTGPFGQERSVLREPPWDGVQRSDAALRDLAPEVVARALFAALDA